MKLPSILDFQRQVMVSNTRETGDGLPLPTVETGVNGDSKSTNERNPSMGGSLGLRAGRYKRFLCC
jgi:hypothetical protein